MRDLEEATDAARGIILGLAIGATLWAAAYVIVLLL
jgi:hypothetical protein